ncbi:MAG: ABC transporter substrate-binding protein [Ruminococcus sp.]|jgi:peptide/nickel transport system substrate-binding protein
MKRKLARLMAVILVGSIFSGCGQSGSDNSSNGSSSAGANEEKHLNIAYHSEISELDPGNSSWDVTRIGVGERLFRINDDLKVEPWLVESYERVDDLTWKMTLKDGIEFSNGKEMDGETVKECLERTIEMNQRAVTMLNIASIEAEGQTLTIKTNDINAALPNNMADCVCTILDVDTLGKEDIFPVGTGPFVIESMGSEQMELTANDNYWDGEPKLDSVTIKYITDGNAQAMALDNGEVDLVFQLPSENIDQFRDNENFVLTEQTGSRSQFIHFNLENTFLSDLNVRKAICMAIDRESFADVINKGNSQAATAIFPVSFAYGNVEGIRYDPDEAQKLLEESGYTDSDGDGIRDKNGEPMSFQILTYGTHGSLLPTFCEAIQASLKELGIELDIQVNDYEPHLEALEAGNFDMALSSYIMAPVADPQYFADIALRTDADYNYGHYSNQTVDDLIMQLDQEFDEAKRTELTEQIQEEVVKDCAFFTLGHLKYQIVAADDVSGYSTQATELYLLNEDTDIER